VAAARTLSTTYPTAPPQRRLPASPKSGRKTGTIRCLVQWTPPWTRLAFQGGVARRTGLVWATASCPGPNEDAAAEWPLEHASAPRRIHCADPGCCSCSGEATGDPRRATGSAQLSSLLTVAPAFPQSSPRWRSRALLRPRHQGASSPTGGSSWARSPGAATASAARSSGC